MPARLPRQLLTIIDTLNADQLHMLHHVVAERLQLAQRAQTVYAMSQFHVLDRVSFVHNGRAYEGTVIRLNQKTVAVVLDDGSRWNVAPSLLTSIDAGTARSLRVVQADGSE
jgi:hypothetical protein